MITRPASVRTASLAMFPTPRGLQPPHEPQSGTGRRHLQTSIPVLAETVSCATRRLWTCPGTTLGRIRGSDSAGPRPPTSVRGVWEANPAVHVPAVRSQDTAPQHRTIWVEPLPDHFEADLIQAGKHSQVRLNKGSNRSLSVKPKVVRRRLCSARRCRLCLR